MKQITNFIKEGFRINKNTKVQNRITIEIIEFLYQDPNDVEPEVKEIINNWVEDQKVENLTIICSVDALLKYYNDTIDDVKEIIDIYNNNDNVNLILQDDTFTDIGDLIWKDTYEHTRIFINKKTGWMMFHTANNVQIYFVPKNMSAEEAQKYTMK